MGSLGIVPNLGQIYNPDSFTGDGSNTTFTLTHLVTSDQSVIWVEGGVVQKPGIDFTISGLTLTRTTAPANLVACFAMYLGVSLDIGTPSDGTVTLAKMAANSIDSDQYVDGSIDAVHLSANSVDSDAYVDGSIDAVHMSANSIDSDSYVDGSIDAVHLSANSVDSDAYVDASIDNAHLADDAVGIAELSATGTASSSTFLRGDNSWVATAHTGNVAFPATQVASADANTLDDYEEGTWTPVVGGASGTSGQSYSNQIGIYTKIGSTVFCRFLVALSTLGTVSGNAEIQGLPFATSSSQSNRGGGGMTDWYLLNTAQAFLSLYPFESSSKAIVRGLVSSNVSSSSRSSSIMGNSTNLTGWVFYQV